MLIDVDVVSNLAKVVNFDAFADESRAHGCTINGTIGPDFNVVFNDNVSNLRNFAVDTIFVRGKTKAVRANYGTGMNDAIGTYMTIFVNVY